MDAEEDGLEEGGKDFYSEKEGWSNLVGIDAPWGGGKLRLRKPAREKDEVKNGDDWGTELEEWDDDGLMEGGTGWEADRAVGEGCGTKGELSTLSNYVSLTEEVKMTPESLDFRW